MTLEKLIEANKITQEVEILRSAEARLKCTMNTIRSISACPITNEFWKFLQEVDDEIDRSAGQLVRVRIEELMHKIETL